MTLVVASASQKAATRAFPTGRIGRGGLALQITAYSRSAYLPANLPDHRGIQFMLCDLNPSMKPFRGVAGQNRHLALRDDIAMVDLLIHVVDGASGQLFSGLQRLFPRFESRKLWQKRWMNIYDAPRKCIQHRRFENAHETGESYELDSRILEHSHKVDLGLRLQTRAKPAWRQVTIGNRKFPRDIEYRRVEHIRDHDTDLRRQGAICNALENRAAIASLSRSKNAKWNEFHFPGFRSCSSRTDVE